MANIVTKSTRHLSHRWQIVLAFLLGGAVSSLAQDPSDFAFFWAQSHGLTSPTDQTVFWYWVPFLLYIMFFVIGFVLARARLVSAVFMVYFLMVIFVLSAVYSLTLPQVSSNVYVASVIIGTVVSVGILVGLRNEVK